MGVINLKKINKDNNDDDIERELKIINKMQAQSINHGIRLR